MASKKRRVALPSKAPLENSGTEPTLTAFLQTYATVIALALILFASVRIALTYTVFNHTSDEPNHIACGLEWLQNGTYTFETQHPPLARVAAALGPYLLGARIRSTIR